MKKYTFTYTCGHQITVDADNEDNAKVKFREVMTEDAAKAHFAEKHPGQTMPPYEDLMTTAILVEEPAPEAPAA